MCADDTYGNNPGVDLNGAMPGVYEVFVGSYSQGQNAPYTVGLTELRNVAPGGGAAIAVPPTPPAIAVPVAPPVYGGGAAVLAPGFMPDPRIMAGVSGGPMSAMAMNPTCRGYVGARIIRVVSPADEAQNRMNGKKPARVTV